MRITPQDLVDSVRAMVATDMSVQPNFIFVGALREALVGRGFYNEDAEKIAVRMKVKLEADAFTNEQLVQMAGDYADILVNIRDALKNQGFKAPMDALLEMAPEMSLTYG
jgi:Na+-translocating ferredoxin:NAD+ oxidoreductase RnfE subunit